MTQGLRQQPATASRLGIGLVLLGTALGCQGTDKVPSSSGLPPPPKLPATLPAPNAGAAGQPARTAAPPVTPATNTQAFGGPVGESLARGGMSQAGVGQPPPIGTPTLPTTGGTLQLTPATARTTGRGSVVNTTPPEPSSTYQPPPVLQNPIPPSPPAGAGSSTGAPVGPPTVSVTTAPALPAGPAATPPAGPIAVPSAPISGN